MRKSITYCRYPWYFYINREAVITFKLPIPPLSSFFTSIDIFLSFKNNLTKSEQKDFIHTYNMGNEL